MTSTHDLLSVHAEHLPIWFNIVLFCRLTILYKLMQKELFLNCIFCFLSLDAYANTIINKISLFV